MPNIREYNSPVNGVSPTNAGVDAAAATGRRVAGFYDEAAAAQGRVASAFEQGARTDEQLARVQGEAGRVQEGAFNAIGRMAESTIHERGAAVVQYYDHKQISTGSVAFMGVRNQLGKEWDEVVKNSDPNDPTIAEKFLAERVEPALEKFKQGFTTENSQAWAERQAESLRNHMFEKSTADMATLAADSVSVNVRRVANTASNEAMRDPSAVPSLLGNIDDTVGAMVDSSPNLKGAAAAHARTTLTQSMKEHIVKSGAIGAIMQSSNPEATAAAWGERYPEYISGDELKMLGANARAQLRAARVDANYGAALKDREVRKASDNRETDYLQKLYSDDPKEQGGVSSRAIVNDPLLTRESKERMIGVVNRELKPETEAKVSAATSVQIIRMMRNPDADPATIRNAIFDARTKDPGQAGSLNKADFADLQKQLIDLKTPEGQAIAADRGEFFKRYAPTIDPSMGDISSFQFGHHTALGLQKMYAAERDARREEERLRKAGQDPHSLYDPSSPNFFGKPANLMKYQASMQDASAYQAGLGQQKALQDRKDAAPTFKPPANWLYSESRKQYRDPAGVLYDINGKPVK